jgi:uncharacterized protein YcbX
MHLSEIWIYPIKSLGGIRLSEAQVQERGLQYDRRWMLVDEAGLFLTQRTYPQLTFLYVSLANDGLQITDRRSPGETLLIPYSPISAQTMQVTVWDDTVTSLTVSNEADAWLSRILNKKVHIVFMPDTTARKADPRYARRGENVSFADGFPFLMISSASLEDLNQRLPAPIGMERFRPNFVVAGASAFGEDAWILIRIGNIEFEVVKPCSRCILTTIDPVTGEKGPEPLKTLGSYRRTNNKVLFGQNLVAVQKGMVAQTDKIIVLQ